MRRDSRSMRVSIFSLSGLVAGALVVVTLAAVHVSSTWSADALGGKKKQPVVKRLARLGDFSEWVTSLEFSPDGSTLAVGTYLELRLWNTKSKKIDATLKAKSGFVKAVAFSPDGKLLATGCYQNVELWDAKTHKRIRTLENHFGYVTGVAFSPDGKLLATCGDDETIRLWDAMTGKPGHVMELDYPVQAIDFSPDGRLLASASGDETRVTRPGEVILWDVATGKQKQSLVKHKKVATGVAFSPDGKHLASTSQDEKVHVYVISTGKPLGFFKGHSRSTNAAVFSRDGQTVISAAGGRARGGNVVKIWDRDTGEEKTTIEGHTSKISCLALAPDGVTLATGSYDKSVSLWSVGRFVTAASTPKALRAIKPLVVFPVSANKPVEKKESKPTPAVKHLRVGIIGLDTSHATHFTALLNDPRAAPDVAHCRVVAAYPKGSPDIESSVSRVPGYTKDVQALGVEIVDSIDALIAKVDVVLLETNDGRPHLEQILPVLKAGNPVFIDKPIAGSLTDAVAIFEASRRYKTPVFSSSSLRYGTSTQAVRNGSLGRVTRCETYSPCSLEKTHPDLFWYGIHGVESLFTVMGTGCISVKRTESTPDHDFVEGVWKDDRVGIFRGYRKGKSGYGGFAVGEKGRADVGASPGYRPLVVDIVKFFRTGKIPVSAEETLELYAFMEAADESKRQGGVSVTIESVLAKASSEADRKLEKLIPNTSSSSNDNLLTAKEKADGWQLLFNGKDNTGWKCNNGKPIATKVEDGSLVPYKSGGYIVIHEKQFGDFIFKCDVKMGKYCNSGVFFRIGNPLDPVQTGFEMQVHTGKGTGMHDFGSIYDLVRPSKNTARGPGEWNSITITCKGPHISVAVNGEVVTRMNCDEWTEPGKRLDGSKHKYANAVKNFPRKGYLGFQDHGHKVWYKNVKIKDLSKR